MTRSTRSVAPVPFAALVVFAALASARPARALDVAPTLESAAPPPVAGNADQASAQPVVAAAQRRSGLVVGTSFGAGLYGSSGYPDSALKTGDPAYYSSSGLMVGSSTELFVMGALADVFNFGLWFAGSSAQNGTFRSSGAAGGFRVEAFPLYTLSPGLRDLGVLAKFGVGGTTLETKEKVSPGASGTQSFVGCGVFYERRIFSMLGGHVSIAPALEYQAIFSTSAERHGAFLGARLAFYGGP